MAGATRAARAASAEAAAAAEAAVRAAAGAAHAAASEAPHLTAKTAAAVAQAESAAAEVGMAALLPHARRLLLSLWRREARGALAALATAQATALAQLPHSPHALDTATLTEAAAALASALECLASGRRALDAWAAAAQRSWPSDTVADAWERMAQAALTPAPPLEAALESLLAALLATQSPHSHDDDDDECGDESDDETKGEREERERAWEAAAAATAAVVARVAEATVGGACGGPRAAEVRLARVCSAAVRTEVRRRCAGRWEGDGRLAAALAFLEAPLQPWLTAAVGVAGGTQVAGRLRLFTLEQFALLRMEELFSIIVDFPDSRPALEDLGTALQQTSQLPQLVAGLRAAFDRRLLHQGAHTADILAQYIGTLRALQIVDRSGGATRAVAAPLCEYLRGREDTVRRVVAMFVDESGELFEELSTGGEGEGETEGDGEGGRDDVFSRLVDIYGSKDLLVAEYRNVLAERLLGMASYDTERETRVLELLKQRFGEACMQHCYIMLKDLTDSRRLDEYVESRMQETHEEKSLAATVVSHLFWPSLKEEELRLPPQVAQWMEAYARHYRSQRRSRSLRWLPHLGRVDLELVVNGEARDFSVTPLQASVVHHFQAQSVWDVVELAEELNVTTAALRRQLAFWASQGVLQPTDAGGTGYRVREEHEDEEPTVGLSASMELDDEAGSSLASGAAQEEEMWKMCHNSVKAMLLNQGSMTAEKVHMLLTMFLAEEYSASVDQLRTFMDSLVAAEEMTKEDGVYSAVKR